MAKRASTGAVGVALAFASTTPGRWTAELAGRCDDDATARDEARATSIATTSSANTNEEAKSLRTAQHEKPRPLQSRDAWEKQL
jgi:hypothetical protein